VIIQKLGQLHRFWWRGGDCDEFDALLVETLILKEQYPCSLKGGVDLGVGLEEGTGSVIDV